MIARFMFFYKPGVTEVRGKKEEVPAHLLVVLDRWEKVGKVLDGGGQGAAARFSGEGLATRGGW